MKIRIDFICPAVPEFEPVHQIRPAIRKDTLNRPLKLEPFSAVIHQRARIYNPGFVIKND